MNLKCDFLENRFATGARFPPCGLQLSAFFRAGCARLRLRRGAKMRKHSEFDDKKWEYNYIDELKKAARRP